MSTPPCVLIVDDHLLLRQSLRRFIEAEEDLAVCADVGTPAGALEACDAHPPNVVLLDVALKDADGIELAQTLRRRVPKARVVVLTMHKDPDLLRRAFDAGARGYLTKEEPMEHVIEAIHRVLEGRTYIGESMFDAVVPLVTADDTPEPDTPADRLTDREREVLDLIGRGYTTGRVAETLFLSPKTVNTHRENMKRKLGLADAAALNEFANRWVHSEP